MFLYFTVDKPLFWSAVANGIVAVPLLVALMWLVTRRSVMGPFRPSAIVLALAALATLVMAAAAVATVAALI